MPIRRREIGNPGAVSLSLSGSSGFHVHFFASSLLKSLYVMTPAALQTEMAATHTTDYDIVRPAFQRPRRYHTCTQSRKKLRLKSTPDRTYLFVTVIRMEEPQYARIAATGFSVIDVLPLRCTLGARGSGDGARNSLPAGISIL